MGACDRFDSLMWLSYLKGRLSADATAEMELHSASCNECRDQLDFFRKIIGIIELHSTAPPESWTKEAGEKFRLAGSNCDLSRVFGEMVFDSDLHDEKPIRSRTMEARHLIFDSPKVQVDLVMESSGRQLKSIIGQLLAKPGEHAEPFEESVLTMTVASCTYTAVANRFGEFLFKIDAEMTGEPLELRYTFEEETCVILIPV